MIKGVSHIAIAVRSLDETIPFYRDVLGLPFEGTEVVPEQKVKVAFFLAGPTRIELLEATTEDSPISKFVAERGGGIHHLALQTDDVAAEITSMQEHQIRMIDAAPRGGAHHTQIAFMHPKAAHGVLLELTQESQHLPPPSPPTAAPHPKIGSGVRGPDATPRKSEPAEGPSRGPSAGGLTSLPVEGALLDIVRRPLGEALPFVFPQGPRPPGRHAQVDIS